MTIPEISPLFLLSMCGLSVVCTGLFGVVGVIVFRFFTGDLLDGVTGLLDREDNPPQRQTRTPTPKRNFQARAQSFDFDAAVGGGVQGVSNNQFGENSELRPNRRPTFNTQTRDLNLAPPERLSDDGRNLRPPAPPSFSAGDEYLPNERSNIGGRVGRHNTGRGQSGQRMDSGRFTDLDKNLRSSGGLRSDRNLRRDDEFFGGQADFDGDGDPDI